MNSQTIEDIEIRPRSRTSDPVRVPHTHAVESLRDAEAELNAFRAKTAAEGARLEAQRLAALELQEQYLALKARRAALQGYLDVARSALAGATGRMLELTQYCVGNLGSPLHDHINEYLRHKFMADLLPPRIAESEQEVTDADAQIRAFEQQHGIGK